MTRAKFDDLPKKRPPADWIAQGFLRTKDIGILYGAPGVLKSWLALDLALHVAHGEAWGPFKIPKPRTVLLIDEESDEESLADRRWGLFKETCERGQLIQNEGIRWVSGLQARLPRAEFVIVDTLFMVFHGDLNDPQHVRMFQRACKEFTLNGQTLLFVHHVAKPTEIPRSSIHKLFGSTFLAAEATALYCVERLAKNKSQVTAAKTKRFEEPEPFIVELQGSTLKFQP